MANWLLKINKKGYNIEEFPVLIGAILIDIIVVVTVVAIANANTERGFDYYGLALSQNLDRIYASDSCFAYNDGFQTFIGALDKSKISSETLKKCLKNENLGIRIVFDEKDVIYNDEFLFASKYSSCVVAEKPYSCEKRELKLVVYENGNLKNTNVRIEGVLKHA
ncbi:MAG: hypothetical protein AABW87_00020 [Nanoarchaeota archaeon]